MKTWRLVCILFSFLFVWNSISWPAPTQNSGPLSFEQRVQYERAIEQVYWRHQIWPGENRTPKPSRNPLMTDSLIRAKVEDYLKKSSALAEYWQRPIQPQQLQAEMDRIVKNTKQPAMLQELFAALGNNPQIIAECLVRPALVERLMRGWYSSDERFHGALKHLIESELRVTTSQSIHALSGRYSEMQISKSNQTELDAQNRTLHLTASEWDKRARLHQVGKISKLQEETDQFYVVAVLEKDSNHMKTATVEWPKKRFEEWWASEKTRITSNTLEVPYLYSLADSPGSPCANDTWTAISSTDMPDARTNHTVVWTGSEMIIWGGLDTNSGLSSGGRYDPATDNWTPTNVSQAPEGRSGHTAVWTGMEMVIWGGYGNSSGWLSNGGRYIPVGDAWIPMSSANAPEARYYHSAVWTGDEMIVWGGESPQGFLATGGRYNVSSDTWVATNTNSAPQGRRNHTAIWAGDKMIIWGGWASDGITDNYFSTGARYDSFADTWTDTTTTNAPQPRAWHTAVWTGSQMIVWGGYDGNSLSDGSRYDPNNNSWTPINNAGAPSARNSHTAIYTGTEMIVWGGYPQTTAGGRYDLSSNSWLNTSLVNAPSPRFGHTVVWTGEEMLIWGGFEFNPEPEGDVLATGGRYCASFMPAIYIDDASITEGNSGTIDLNFNVNTFIPSTQDITINYQTADDTATVSDGDYQSANNSITIPAGQTQGTITIHINGDTKYENYETFFVNLTSATNATIGDGQAQGEITNDDAQPSLTISDGTHIEPEPVPGLAAITLVVTLSFPVDVDVHVDYATQQNTATADVDFQTTSGTLIIPAGSTTGTILTTILHDGLAEGNESYYVNLSNPVNATIADLQGECIITNRQPFIFAGPAPLSEGNSGTTPFVFTIHSSFAYSLATSFNYTTQNGSAVAPGDYASTSGTLTIPANTLSNTVTVSVVGDTTFEPDESFTLKLLNCTRCIFQNDTGMGLILNDDPAPPMLSINDISRVEGNSGFVDFVFTISLNQVTNKTVKVNFDTAAGTADSSDFKPKSANVSIMAGSLSTTVAIKVKGDTVREANETFFGLLSNPTGAIIADGSGTATILNDD